MPKEKTKKLNIMSCKCEVSDNSPGDTSVHKNCKCKVSGRKEREYEQVLVEKK